MKKLNTDYQQHRIDFALMSNREVERTVDRFLRDRGSEPREYLMHWLWVARHFGYATRDDSWGEFEKEFAIIICRLVRAERELEALKAILPKRHDPASLS